MSTSGSGNARNGGGEGVSAATAAGRARVAGGSSKENEENPAAVLVDVKQRALATICLNLETYNYSLVMDAKDARTAWKKLESAFQDRGLTRKIGLLRKFTSIRIVNSPSVEAYVDLKIFGSSVMILVPKVKRKRFDPKSEKGIFVGYCEDTNGYRVYDPVNERFHISRDVVVLDEGFVIQVAEQRVEPVEFMELRWNEFINGTVIGAADLPEAKQLVADVVPCAAGTAEENNQLNEDPGDIKQEEDVIEDACTDFALPPQLNRPAD